MEGLLGIELGMCGQLLGIELGICVQLLGGIELGMCGQLLGIELGRCEQLLGIELGMRGQLSLLISKVFIEGDGM